MTAPLLDSVPPEDDMVIIDEIQEPGTVAIEYVCSVLRYKIDVHVCTMYMYVCHENGMCCARKTLNTCVITFFLS